MISNLDIRVEQRDGVSFLKDAYVTQPFRIVPVGQYKKDNAAYLMIMSSSPGLLDGDDHQIKIHLAQKSTLQLQTQAYQRLFHMKDKSTQTTVIRMEQDSAFAYIPHPIVPQKSSTFLSHNVIKMDEGCHLLMSEIVTCGRKMSGEVFEYNTFQNLTEVYHHDKLVIKDNVLLKAQSMPLQSLTFLEGFTHQGSLIYYNSAKRDIRDYIELFYNQYKENRTIEFGISKVQGDGFIVRILGNGAEQLFQIFQDIQQVLWNKEFLIHNSTIIN